jgi:hypothetical protein
VRDTKQHGAKPPMHLLPLDGLVLAAVSMALGEAKGYLRRSWQAAEDPEIYLGAGLRHITQILNGEDVDDEGNSHVGGAIASLLIYAWHHVRGYRVKKFEPKWVVNAGERSQNGSGNVAHLRVRQPDEVEGAQRG